MSREIKFRAWYAEEEEIYDVAKVDMWGDLDQATCDLASIDNELFDIYLCEVEIMQYTGFEDKNGKGIYEGDILKNIVELDGKECTVYSEVVFFNGCFIMREKGYEIAEMFLVELVDNVEVVGNIYENRELLEESNE